MHGGNRKGSGRKQLPKHEKKKCKNIYITDNYFNEIMSIEMGNFNTFSQKCVELIKLGLKYRNEDNESNMKTEIYPKNSYLKQKSDINQKPINDKLTFIDLFAGIGGIRKAFEDKHTTCVFSSEWDKYASQTYEANYGEKPHGDITKINEEDIPLHDILLAGFPCQPFSHIGKREGFSHGTQGTLFLMF